ncbi:MAG: hypothetical protein OXT69_08150 [Candidatus Poribacteria bacterium]|nr:hypothetical protein [Candidatus Poribacteria bacterium]
MSKQFLSASAAFLLALALNGCGSGASMLLYDAEAAHAALLFEENVDAVPTPLEQAEALIERSKEAYDSGDGAESDRLAGLALLRVEEARAALREGRLRAETAAAERALEQTAASADKLRAERNETLDERNALDESNESD